MNDATRLYFGAKSLLGYPSPYRPRTQATTAAALEVAQPSGPSAAGTGAADAAATGARRPTDTFSRVPGQATLHHHRSSYLPLDPGVPTLDGIDADTFAAPPLDLDELAACAGQSRMFGPLVGRLIMGVGSYFALYATVAAASALSEDGPQVDALCAARARIAAQPQTPATKALGRLFGQELVARARARTANWLLLPGALGMSVNLLGSAELLGHFAPALRPVAAFAMGPAAVCMALYGGYIAYTSVQSVAESFRARSKRVRAVRPQDIEPEPWARMQARDAKRERSKRLWDGALAISGLLQAVGALAQWAVGPVWLLALLPGTLGLMLFKLLRVKRFGQHTVTPQLQQGTLTVPLKRAVKQHTCARRRLKILRAIGAHKTASGAVVRGLLADAVAQLPGAHTLLEQALRAADPGAAQEAEQLVRALAALEVFPYLALEIARARHLPRTRNAVTDSDAPYNITGADIVDLVASCPEQQQAQVLADVRQTVASVAATYGAAVALQQEVLMAELEGAMVEDLAA